jgi:hypothetical protein
MLPDDLLLLAGQTPALHLLSEAEDEKPWSDGLLTFLPSTVSARYARWLWWELVDAVQAWKDADAVDREAEILGGRVRSLLARLISGGAVCGECAERLDWPFERLLSSCAVPSHRQGRLRAVAS